MLTAFHRRVQQAQLARTPRLRAPSLESVDPTATLDTDRKGTITLGNNVRICQGAILATFGGEIRIGDNVYIGPYCVLYGHGGLTIGADTLVAAHSVIIPANHVFEDSERPIRQQGETRQGIQIGKDCWLGTGVKVLDGVNIGDGSVIAAGAVVTRPIPNYVVAAGVPARIVKNRGRVSPAVDTNPGEYGLEAALSHE